MSINKVMITGNLTRDAEVRTTQGGMSVANVGIAVNDRKRNQNGEWEDIPNFFELTIWGKRAEALQKYLVKGTKVAVEGRLHWSQWEDRNGGGKRSKVDINVDEIEFLSGQRQQSQRPAYEESASYQAMQQAKYAAQQEHGSQQEFSPYGNLNDEPIPF